MDKEKAKLLQTMIKNAVMLCLAAIMLVTSFFSVIEIKEEGGILGGIGMSGIMVRQSSIQLYAAMLSGEYKSDEIIDDMATMKEKISGETQEDLQKYGFRGISKVQQKEIIKAMSSVNFLRLMMTEEMAELIGTQTKVFLWINFSFCLLMQLGLLFMVAVFAAALIKRKDILKLQNIAVLCSVVLTIAFFIFIGFLFGVNETKMAAYGGGIICTLVLSLISALAWFVIGVVLDADKKRHLQAIKRVGLMAFAVILFSVSLAPNMVFDVKISGETMEGSKKTERIVSVGVGPSMLLSLGDFLEVNESETLSDVYNEFKAQLSQSKKDAQEQAKMYFTKFATNIDMQSQYYTIITLATISSYISLLSSLVGLGLFAVMLYQILFGKYGNTKLGSILPLVIFVLSVIAIVFHAVFSICYMESVTTQKILTSLSVGVGMIAVAVFSLGTLLFNLLFKRDKKAEVQIVEPAA